MTEPFSLAIEKLRLAVTRPMSQHERILRLLKRRGNFGASNRELNSIAYRYSARIYDLRKEGHHIRLMRDNAGHNRFILEDES